MPEETRKAVSCAACGEALGDTYYGVYGRLACARCHSRAAFEDSQVSALGRFVRAGVYGALAGAGGAATSYGVRELTGVDVALVSALVGTMLGTMVGWAVCKGSQNRGGWPFQALAVSLTYLAIASTFVPAVAQGLAMGLKAQEKLEANAARANEPSAATEGRDGEQLTLDETRFGLAVFMIAIAFPFLHALGGGMGAAMILAPMFMAWFANRRPTPAIEGPYSVNAPGPSPGLGV